MLCRARGGAMLDLHPWPVSAWCSCPVIGCLVSHVLITPLVPGLSLSCGLLPAVRLLPL